VLLIALPTEQYPDERFPSNFKVDQRGCYYIQVDGLDFSFTATFPMT